jgi:hypothetical protein
MVLTTAEAALMETLWRSRTSNPWMNSVLGQLLDG